ncbi:MAG: hypothetical protein AAF191_18875 [Verrucomicrobiota bacterium]
MKATTLFLALSLPLALHAQQSARSALGLFRENRGQASVDNIIAISGMQGMHQPVEWEILTRDLSSPDHFLRYQIQNGVVFGPHRQERKERRDLHPVPIVASTTLGVDSQEVFQICDDLAISAGIGYDLINYQLQWRGADPEPTWLASLIDEHNQVIVGHIFVLADSGQVAHQQFFPAAGAVSEELRPVSRVSAASMPVNAKGGEILMRKRSVQHRYGARED